MQISAIDAESDLIDSCASPVQPKGPRSGLLVGVDRRKPCDAPYAGYPGVFVNGDVLAMCEAQRLPRPPLPGAAPQMLLPKGRVGPAPLTMSSVLLGAPYRSPEPCVDVAIVDLCDASNAEGGSTSRLVEESLRASVAAVNVIRPFLHPGGTLLLLLEVLAEDMPRFSAGLGLPTPADAARSRRVKPLLRDLRALFASADCVSVEGGAVAASQLVCLLARGAPLELPFARAQLHSPAMLRDTQRPKKWNRLTGAPETIHKKRGKFFVAKRPAFTTAPSGLGQALVERQRRGVEERQQAAERDETLKDFSFRMFESAEVDRNRAD